MVRGFKSIVALVFLLRPPAPAEGRCSASLGCYGDEDWSRDLAHSIPSSSLPWDSLTVGKCVAACGEANKKFAGLQKGTDKGTPHCWCGDSYGKHGKADGSFNKCEDTCPGRPTEYCGGYNGFAGPNSIYEVPGTSGLCSGLGQCNSGETCDCGDVGRSGAVCELNGICRFAPSYSWDASGLTSDAKVQDAYVREMLTWDGKFASVGLGISPSALTCDHVDLYASGEPHPVKCYTASSKESLHIEMLALIVNRTNLSWHWISDATTEANAVATALQRLDSIMRAYEELNAEFPGLGGYLPWVGVDSNGFALDKDSDVELPALDNGQLAWSMFAAAAALHAAGETALAQRYDAHVALMATSARILFLNPGDGTVWMTGKVISARVPLGTSNRVGSGLLGDPFEGELMVMFLDLMTTWPDPSQKAKMWAPIKLQQIKIDYTHAGLPNGPISVQRGWRFSSHEMWKYMVLPYMDDPLVKRVMMNGERARTWNSKLNGIPGLLGSAWNSSEKYIDRFGIVSISMGYTEPPKSELHITPYGAFPLILADRGYGLAWHRAMLGRPQMQCVLGSVESSLAFPPTGTTHPVAAYTSWDTKVTVNLAALGGVGRIIGHAFAAQPGRLERFQELVKELHEPYFSTLSGEDTAFAEPPTLAESDDSPSPSPDFENCRRLASVQVPPLTTTTTTTTTTITTATTNATTTTTTAATTTTTIVTTTLTTAALTTTTHSSTKTTSIASSTTSTTSLTTTATTSTTLSQSATTSTGGLALTTTTTSSASVTTDTVFVSTTTTASTTIASPGAYGTLLLNISAPNSSLLSVFVSGPAARLALGNAVAQLANMPVANVSLELRPAKLQQSLSASGDLQIVYRIAAGFHSEAQALADRLAGKHPATVSAFMLAALVRADLLGYNIEALHISATAAGQPCSGTSRATCAAPTGPSPVTGAATGVGRMLFTSAITLLLASVMTA